MSALIVIAKTPEKTHTVRFTFSDGHMTPAIEMLADCLVELGVAESVHEAVAADRLGIILRQNQEIQELQRWAALGGWCAPVKEAAG